MKINIPNKLEQQSFLKVCIMIMAILSYKLQVNILVLILMFNILIFLSFVILSVDTFAYFMWNGLESVTA